MPDARFRQFTTGIQIKTNLFFFKQLTLFSLVFVLARSVLYIFHGMKLWAAEFILFAYSVWILPLQWLNYGLFHFDLDSNLYFSSSLLHFILSFRIFFFTPVEGFFYNCSDVCEALLLIIAPSRGEMLCHRRGYLIPSDCVYVRCSWQT